MEIKVGNFYRTKNCSKAFVYGTMGNDFKYPYFYCIVGHCYSGNSYCNKEGVNPSNEEFNLISEWIENE